MQLLIRSLARYAVAVLVILLPALLVHDVQASIVVIILALSVKFLVYDMLLGVLWHYRPGRESPWLYNIAYGATVLIDSVYVFIATREGMYSGFALVVPIIFTPWILIGAAGIMLVRALRTQPKGKK